MQLGVCYYPEHWPAQQWASDARRMRENGLSFVRIGEFAWSRLEPRDGVYDFDWMRRVIDLLSEAGLGVVLGTPTATPPKWLVDKIPDMLAVDQWGRTRRFGSRRHYCFSSETYARECDRIVTALAREFGAHPGVVAWQTDNEYGCHDTVESYSQAAALAFRRWCEKKYGSIEHLNEAWGNVFWSMEYASFDEIDPPGLCVTEANPAHRLNFQRFSSDQVKRFNARQVAILRAHSQGRPIAHNFMGAFAPSTITTLRAISTSPHGIPIRSASSNAVRMTTRSRRAICESAIPIFRPFITISIAPAGAAAGGSWSSSPAP